MSLTIETKELENRQLGMTIEVPEKRVTGQMKKIVKKLANDYKVPGFRKGKAPYGLMLKRFGEESIRYQAVEEIMDEVINEALAQQELEPAARLSLDDLTLYPAVKIDVTVPLSAEVTLGDYRAIRKDLDVPEVSDDAVTAGVSNLLESHAATEQVIDRAATLGDMIKITGHGAVNMETAEEATEAEPTKVELFHDHDGIEFELDVDKTFPGTDFVANIVGMDVGDEKSFTITYADDYEVSDFAGKTADINITLIEIFSRTLPELNDEFAVEANYESVEDMQAKIRTELEAEAMGTFKSEILDGWIEDLLKDATIVHPPALVDQELDNSLNQLKEQVKSYKWEWADYIKEQGKSEDEIKEEWREDAAKNVKNGLALREFISSERLKVREDELNARIDEQIDRYGAGMEPEMREMMRNILLGNDGIQRIANEVMVDKAYDRIEMILGGNAPDLDELDAIEAAEDEARGEAAAQAAAEAAHAAIAEANATQDDDEASEADVEEAADGEETDSSEEADA